MKRTVNLGKRKRTTFVYGFPFFRGAEWKGGSLFNCLKFQIKKYQNMKNENYFKRTKKKVEQEFMRLFLQFLFSKAQI